MKKLFWMLLPVLTCGVLISACQPQIKPDANPTPVVPATAIVGNLTSTATPETIDTMPTKSVTAEPAPVENKGETTGTWTGTIKSFPAGSQFDDYFEYGTNTCGIDVVSDEINQLIAQYRDSGVLVKIEGVLTLDVPDANGRQIRVSQVEEG